MIFIVKESIVLIVRSIVGCFFFFLSFQRRAMSTNCGAPGETYFNYARIITRLLANGDLLAGGTIHEFLFPRFAPVNRTMNYDCINNL